MKKNTTATTPNPQTTRSLIPPQTTTHFATTSESQRLIEFCSNFTNCGSCMKSNELYNISCKWKQYDTNLSIATTQSNIFKHNLDLQSISFCTHESQCNLNDDYHCCNHSYCCDCLDQDSCIMCGAQGLNESCTWDHSINACFEEPTCIGKDKCLNNPMLTECEYTSSACEFYFSASGYTVWTLSYLGMIIFLICLPCCLYHKCGIDWDTEFSIPIDDEYALQQGDGYVFRGGAHITGRCMHSSFFCIGCLFALLAVFGTLLSISCMADSY